MHNDLNPGWFVDYESGDGINVVRHEICSYTHGDIFVEGVAPKETVRAVVMLFYLNNPSWHPGDGGGTGLYHYQDDPVGKPAFIVPPINNSLLIFECTPYSYHSFVKNWHHPRNCVILWLHRSKDDAISRWGANKIIAWPERGSD